jgi:hypothetical protein
MLSRFAISIAIVGLALGGCLNTDSNTDLVTAGPPELAQVRLNEAYTDTTGSPETRRVFAYGTQPTATADEEHSVTTASATMQVLRVIMDQLLRGNHLEQVACRDTIGTDADGQPTTFGDVPDDATPDDIAKCAVADAFLAASCVGDHLVCLCQIATGCNGVAMGAPVGVLDDNSDGAADHTRFKDGAVSLVCGDNGEIPVPLDLDMSYWNPSGDQLVPAMGGFDALGPAIVLVPQQIGDQLAVMPTNVKCDLKFATDVVDLSNIEVCAPPGGRPADCTGRLADCSAYVGDCTPGDNTAFSFSVEPLTIASPIADGATNVPINLPVDFNSNAPLMLASLAGITISPAVPDAQITLSSSTTIQMVFPTGLAVSTMYTITFPTSITDTFGQALPAPLVVTFTTAAM